MQVEINNTDSILLPFLGHVIFGTDDICDVVFTTNSEKPKKICSIINDKNICIIEVFNHGNLKVNSTPVREMSILHAGDTITIGNEILKIIDENHLPKECTAVFKQLPQKDFENHLVTSTSGLRSFNPHSVGELAIIGSKNSYTHKPVIDGDIPFSVSYLDGNLTVLCEKGKYIDINGNKANYAILRNGDYITTKYAKYCVESPGTSSFSKYSPSHPRNIQLSEEYLINEQEPIVASDSFIKNNLWWISLLAGLALIAIILFLIKNN